MTHLQTGTKTKAPTLLKKAVDLTFERLGESVLCKRCGATVASMPELCSAELDEACEGFVAYDEARTKALHDVGFFKQARKK